MTMDRQTRIHWLVAHLADAILIVLVIGMVVHLTGILS